MPERLSVVDTFIRKGFALFLIRHRRRPLSAVPQLPTGSDPESSSRSRLLDSPRQQLADAIDRVIGDSSQHVTQVCFRVEVVQPRRTDQTVNRSSTPATRVGTSKKIVFPTQCDCTQCPLGCVVVCVLKRCTVLPGENPGRQTLVPAGST